MSQPTRDEWLASRRAWVGSSEIAAVLGLSPFRSEWEVWADKVGVPRADKSEKHQRSGLAWEPVALAHYATELPDGHRLVIGGTTSYPVDGYPIAATPDAIVLGPDGQPVGGVEVKTDRTWGADKAWAPHGAVVGPLGIEADPELCPVPAYYWWQVQTCHAALDVPWWDMSAWLTSGFEVPDRRIIRVERDRLAWEQVANYIGRWWERHVIGGDEPDRLRAEDRMRSAVWRYPARREKRPATEREDELLTEAVTIRRQGDAIDARLTEIRAELRETCRGFDLQGSHGKTIINTKGAFTIRARGEA